MTATDATLDVRRDKQGRSMVTLTNAREGALTLEVPKKDVDLLMLDVGRKMAGPYGVSIDATKLKLDVEDHVLKADLRVTTRLGGFLPAGLFLYWIVFTAYSILQQYLIAGWGALFPLFGWMPGFARNHQPRFPVSTAPIPRPESGDSRTTEPIRSSTDRAAGTIRPARQKARTSRRGRRR